MQIRIHHIATGLLFASTLLLSAIPANGADPRAAVEQEPLGSVDNLPSMLNGHFVASEGVIRLGDLFTNAGPHAETAIAYAPAPGERLVLDARWLYRVASAYGVDWQPHSGPIETVVERDSITIPRDAIKDEILFALGDHGVTGDMDIDITNRFQAVHLAAEANPVVHVSALDFHERTGRFSAMVLLGEGAEQQRLRLTGRAFRTLEVPVLNTRILRGDIIQKRHVTWVRLKADRLQDDVVLDVQDLIGMTPRRTVRPGAPIPSNDLSAPILVEKNSLVTIFHQVPNMTLTAQGKALDDGSEGGVVRVRNERSKQIVEAEVVGPGRVAVRLRPQNLAWSGN